MQNYKLSINGRSIYRRRFKFLILVIILTICTSFTFLQLLASQQSNYLIHSQQSFNQPQYYPLTQTVDPKYQPIGNWVGRLILPKKDKIKDDSDWVWFEVQHAPSAATNLIGKAVRLEWKNQPQLKSYIKAVTRDVNFTPATFKSQKQGNIHPDRLNKRSQVKPLQSLAGARPKDDVIVTLDNAEVIETNNQQILQINQEPVLAPGRFYGLVKIIQRNNQLNNNKVEFFQVRHYNQESGKFDGIEETVYIPQQAIDTRNIRPSTTYKLEDSPAGNAGWYIYGAKNNQSIFTVQALVPRSLFQLQPDKVILGMEAGREYIKQYWDIAATDKGKINKVLIDPSATESQPVSQWQEGDKAIVLNLFGGIGGEKAESLGVPKTITGHFAFGIAQIVRSPFTKELEFKIKYHQIYAHNSDGIISGTQTWANYMGNLQWGWLATRPVTDILVKFDPVIQDYNFDGITISPLNEFVRQLQIMMARYRVGDGTGNATVSPAASCIQDSSQALYSAIAIIKHLVKSNPTIQSWLQNHPNHPQTLRFKQLSSLSSALERELIPLGIVRADWQSNVDILAGIGDTKEPFRDPSIWAGLTTWRTIMPRQAQDELAGLFLKQGAKLWFLQTYQVGGWNPEIAPLAPTPLFGQIKLPFTKVSIISIILNRILASVFIPAWHDWLIASLALLIYAAIAIPLGFSTGFLHLQTWSTKPIHYPFFVLRCLLTPAITEEFFFRVLFIPHPTEVVNWSKWIWAGLSLLIFVIYHPLNAKSFYKDGYPTFFDPIFLILATLLGITCTITYALTGSAWIIIFIHWVLVVLWLAYFGGMSKLEEKVKG
ncbi:type II CAAX prenyl endopeptidase Rce1 family protein [Rivularia sp. UHCC 0363]|uniref:CPBP family glutamic-type intramembrane protease n=1 Tax=Rivularia sp. UHCC 0363 TaxID=3110244 RepID=UPI002B2052AA|nr:CPBP family glutamic-type intramembrane protease [Rivularia sp. UHCC 0363]MEA5594502.1 CPBP family glutamic-type intramembrane protease [Rivularia sp. UHCC 0363]